MTANQVLIGVLAGGVDGPVYRLAARLPGHGVVAPYTDGEVLFLVRADGP